MMAEAEVARRVFRGGSILPAVSGLVVSYVALATAAINLPSTESGLSPFWYANAVAALIFLSRPTRQWPHLFGALIAAIIAVNILSGTEPAKLLIYLCSNLVDVTLAASMIRYVCRIDAEWSGAMPMFKVLFYGGMVPALLSSLVGTALYGLTGPIEFLPAWMIWFESNILGYVSLLPIGVIILTRGLESVLQSMSQPMSIVWLLVVTLCVAGAPFVTDYPYVYISTLLFIIGGRSKLPLAAISVLLASLVLGVLTATELFTPVNSDEVASLNSAYLPLILVLVPPILFAASIEEGARQFQEISRLAHTDPLTSLSSRSVIQEEVELACESGKRHGDVFAVLYMDLDEFKSINDAYGHSVGDHVLTTVAQRVEAALRVGDVVSRMGGDEFAILVNRITSPSDTSMVAQKLLDVVAEDISVEQITIKVRVSIGIAVFPQDGQTASTLLECADRAMYVAKSSGQSSYRHYGDLGIRSQSGAGGVEIGR